MATTRIEFGWGWHEARLRAAKSYWVVTVRPDGRPHAAPVWGVWLRGALWFATSPDSVKARNLAAEPRVTVHLDSSDDLLLLDGRAEICSDAATLAEPDAAYRDKYRLTGGEPAGLVGGSPVFRVLPEVGRTWLEPAFPQTMTRWRFASPPDAAEPRSEPTSYG